MACIRRMTLAMLNKAKGAKGGTKTKRLTAAWDTDEEQRAWIRRGVGDNPDRTRRLEQVLKHTRERGFDVDWTTPALAQAVQVVATLDSNEMPTPVRHIMDQLLVEFTTIGFLSDDNPGRRKQPVVTIAAPVFDDRRRVALMLAVHPLCPLNARQIRVIGKHLTEDLFAQAFSDPCFPFACLPQRLDVETLPCAIHG